MQEVRYAFGAAVFNGKLYVCGGRKDNSVLKSCEVYDPKTDSWSFIASLKEFRYHFTLTSCNGKLYAIGGRNGIDFPASVEEYWPKRNKWTFVTALPAKAYDLKAVAVPIQ